MFGISLLKIRIQCEEAGGSPNAQNQYKIKYLNDKIKTKQNNITNLITFFLFSFISN